MDSWKLTMVTAIVVALSNSSPIRADYVSAVLGLAPDHCYRLDETSVGTVADSATPPSDGIHFGLYGNGGGEVGVAGVSLPGFDAANKAFAANDAGTVLLGSSDTFASPTMTLALWFTNANPTGAQGTADRFFQNNDPTSPLTVCSSTVGGLHFATGVALQDSVRLAPSRLWLINRAWHHLVLVRNGNDTSNLTVYVDGVDRTGLLSADFCSWANSGTNAWIGAADVTQGLGLANGAIDEVAIWNNRALTATEIQTIYEAAVGAAPEYSGYAGAVLDTNPIAYYRFEEDSSTTAGDGVRNWVHPSWQTNTLGVGTASHSSAYPNSAPSFGEIGPQPSDCIAGGVLAGLESGNHAAKFLGVLSGGTDMINIGANPAWLSEQKTYSLLFQTTASGRYARLIASDPESEDDFDLVMDAGKLILVGDRSAGGATGMTTETYNDGLWHHVVALRGGDLLTDLRLFVDGQLVGLNDYSELPWIPPASGRIGARTIDSTGFCGLLDEVVLWDRALSDDEALGLFDVLTATLGDANNDGYVDSVDASILALHWRHDGASWADGDFNGDGRVDERDASILASHWNPQPEQHATVPEPPMPALLVMLAATIILPRRPFGRRRA